MSIDRIAVLRTHLDADPYGTGFAAMTDAQVAEAGRIKSRPGSVPIVDVREYVQNVPSTIDGRSLWLRAEDAAIDHPVLAVRDACRIALLRIMDDGRPNIALGHPKVAEVFTALTTADPPVWSAEDTAGIAALAQNRRSLWEELGLGDVREADVQIARSLHV